MNNDDVRRVLALNLGDKSQRQIWTDALETLGKEAAKAIEFGDHNRANAILDKIDLILSDPKQFREFKKEVERLAPLWPFLVEVEELFTRFDELTAKFAIAVDPTDELNTITNAKDDEQTT